MPPENAGVDPTEPQKTPAYRALNQLVPLDPRNPSLGLDVPPGGADVPPGVAPPGGEVPPDEVLKALHIVNVEGMGYMKATQGPNGTIVMVPARAGNPPNWS